jgi:hypothetical protein
MGVQTVVIKRDGGKEMEKIYKDFNDGKCIIIPGDEFMAQEILFDGYDEEWDVTDALSTDEFDYVVISFNKIVLKFISV